MRRLLAFGGSTSSTSINRALALYVAGLVPDSEVTDLDLRSLNLPIYSSDLEQSGGIPADAQRFRGMIEAHDGIVLSLAEHNGSYTAAFKNLYDWTSRFEKNVWGGKPMLLLSTSPGARGGATVMAAASATFPRMGADLRATFSLPAFYENFAPEEGIKDPALAAELQEAIAAFASPE